MTYEKSLERAKEYYNDKNCMEHIKSILEYIFPELKESEDEKIRKALIRFHHSTIDLDGIKGEEILAWLEKQGEYSSTVGKYFITPEESLEISSDEYNEVVNDCIFGDEKKPQVDGFDAELNSLLKKYEHLPKEEILGCLNFYVLVLGKEMEE